MFEVNKVARNRLVLELSGKLDRESVQHGLDAIVELSRGFSDGQMLYRINDFQVPSLGVLARELRRLPQLFGLLDRFDRVAVLTDQRWLRRISQIKGALLPGVLVKGFADNEEAAALRWLDGGA